jgi:hypothetical protein
MSPPPPTIASINPAAKAAAQSKIIMYVSIDYNSTSREFILIPVKNSPAFLNYTIIDELLNQKYILT